ncbi:MAG: hypothetical protein Q9216_001006 [Gyalolechia sp. 2 TL-2023]
MAYISDTTNPLSVVILGTCDTKLLELLHLRSRILLHAEASSITLIDVGRSPTSDPAVSIPQGVLLAKYRSSPPSELSTFPQSKVIRAMTECATACLQDLYSTAPIHGVIAVGGSGGTSLTSAAMRCALPFLIPKLIVSTVASGSTASLVGETDITLMYSIVDIAGSNSILDSVLDNAAGAIVGMARAYQKRQLVSKSTSTAASIPGSPLKQKRKKRRRIGITMFGVTTPCVDTIRHHLTSSSSPVSDESNDPEVFTFHATGHGGLAMERLISAASSGLDAVIDLTTTEIADEIVGGVMSAGPSRLEAAAKAGIPQVISLGACDVVNFGPRHTLPRRFSEEGRNIYEHNSSVTLVRTNEQECKRIGEFVAGKLKAHCARPELVEVVIPEGGLSALGKGGGVYEDREADAVLFTTVEEGLRGSGVRVVRDERDINDEGFARAVAERLIRLIEKGESKGPEVKSD